MRVFQHNFDYHLRLGGLSHEHPDSVTRQTQAGLLRQVIRRL